jgi:hypothetical protein
MNRLTLDLLDSLVGEWVGKGRVEYPTIETSDYLETFIVRRDPDQPFFTYELQTELLDADGRTIRKSHWEAGLLRPLKDGTVELSCVHGSGRVETLQGTFASQEPRMGKFILNFRSKVIGNDEQMISSMRDWTLDGDQFRYEMRMATTTIGEPTIHLIASLTKE